MNEAQNWLLVAGCIPAYIPENTEIHGDWLDLIIRGQDAILVAN